MSRKFGADEAFTLHSALEYHGGVRPGSEGFHAAKWRVADVERQKLDFKGSILMGIGAAGPQGCRR